ncbi:MAG TPA: hypothetical protein VE153_19525 [Myxococcus sp.]|jgi:hypothetical protein|nr:hypothetical protein [Myxococcus sp.]
MRTLARVVFAATAVLTFVPTAALAYPPQCRDKCTCTSRCTDTCYIGWTSTTCGESDWRCVDNCVGAREDTQSREEVTASSEESTRVCAEEQPAEES